jgi:hypothetical protein
MAMVVHIRDQIVEDRDCLLVTYRNFFSGLAYHTQTTSVYVDHCDSFLFSSCYFLGPFLVYGLSGQIIGLFWN